MHLPVFLTLASAANAETFHLDLVSIKEMNLLVIQCRLDTQA